MAGPAWEKVKDENGKEHYYLHLWGKKQPDLNWKNKQVREELYDMMNFWFDKGIDGFRMDVIPLIGKPDMTNRKLNGYFYQVDILKFSRYMKEMHNKVFKNRDVMTVGEAGPVKPFHIKLLAGTYNKYGLNMGFHMDQVMLDQGKDRWESRPFKPAELMKVIQKWEKALEGEGWNAWYFNNHDQPRALSRYCNDSPEFRVPAAKMLGTILLTLQGTPFIFMGQELGMTNGQFNTFEDFKDIDSLNYIEECREKQIPDAEILKRLRHASRDNSRTPFQWDNSKNAGFFNRKSMDKCQSKL